MALQEYTKQEFVGRLYLDNTKSVKEFKACRLKIYINGVKRYVSAYRLGKKKLHLRMTSDEGVFKSIVYDDLDGLISAEFDY